MGARHGNKLSSHASADSFSGDSLSFAGLVSIQEQQPKPSPPNQNKHYHHVTQQDSSDFEFSTIKPDHSNSSAASPFRITPADVLISNGQIKPHAIAFQHSRPFAANNAPISLRSLLAVENIRSNLSSSGQTRKYHEQQLAKTRSHNHKSKEKTETRTTWFGQKVFRSFLSPCRKCQAVQPDAVKVPQTLTGERLKGY